MGEEQYRSAERAVWRELGQQPVEHRVRLTRNRVDVRIQEVGEGPPVVFLHGGPGASGTAWASLAARLPELRCLLVDRPGTGLSAPQRLADAFDVLEQSKSFLVDVVDVLGLESVHVVGSSHGSHMALFSAATHPDRVDRSVHLGCPGFVENMTLTPADRFALLPGAAGLFSRLPVSEKGLRQNLRRLGHSRAMNPDWNSPAEVEWMLALQRHTDTMYNEFATMAAMGTFRRGFDQLLTIGHDTLAKVQSPSLFLWGEHDVYGDEAVGRGVTSAMPAAELEMMPGSGHLCWFDDLDHAARRIRQHLLG